jgi:hypothetical protein
MDEVSGKARVGIHDYKTGEVFTLNKMIFNCHECNKTFSPVKATLQTTNDAHYFKGLWSRRCMILEIEEDKVCGCQEKIDIIMYDNPDPVFASMSKKNHVQNDYISTDGT